MRKDNPFIEFTLSFLLCGVIFIGLMYGMAYMSGCAEKSDYWKEQKELQAKRSEGIIIEKYVKESGYRYNFFLGRFEYMPDRFYFKVRLGDNTETEIKVDAVTYMNKNIGDRVQNKGY